MAQYLSTYHLKNLTVTSGVQYSYIFQPARGINATFLLLHGFPSSAYDWRYQVEDLTTAGYGVLVPDLLGHGKTVKPLSKEDYAYARQSEHLVELLKEEKLETVIGVGHDWGASLLARFMNYHPTYFSAGVFLSSPYRGLERVDLDSLDQLMMQFFGYVTFGYWRFFNTTEAADIIENNHDSFISLVYAADPALQKAHFCPVGKVEEWLLAGKAAPSPVWLSRVEEAIHSKLMLEGGCSGPLNWYKSAIANTDVPHWSQIPPENLIINKPVVFINGQQDPIIRPEAAHAAADEGKKQGFLFDVEIRLLDAGHWPQLEQKKKVSEILAELAQKLAR